MKCFVIMPFEATFDDVYDTIRLSTENAVPGEQVICQRLDEIKGAGRISDDLVRELREAVICVADVTGLNPNVMWEVGYAMALDKPILLLSQNISSLPFDVKDMRTIGYDRKALASTLRKPLAEAFRHTLGSYEVRSKARRVQIPPKKGFTIAVTGSMESHLERTKRRVEALLQPYLSDNTNWMVGSWGDVDELTIRFLADHQQQVVVVGHNPYDISSRALGLIEQFNLPFLPADQEQIPKSINTESNRDGLFITKADLLVLFWNGASTSTRALIEWCQEEGKDHLIGFV